MSQHGSPRTVRAAGEDAVLAKVREVIDSHNHQVRNREAQHEGMPVGPGDDAAILTWGQARLVVTTDTLSEGQDFRLQWWDDPLQAARSIGVKAAAQNLSDINAMGASPAALLISLTLPPETSVDWVREVMEGICEACRVPGAEHCLIAGGDLGSGEVVSVTITALGRPEASRALLRSGARPGDLLAVCGDLGRAAAGLWLLDQSESAVVSGGPGDGADIAPGTQAPTPTPEILVQECLNAQLRPAPDLTAGARALRSGATAGMDISDGLLRDARRLAEASAVSLDLDEAALDKFIAVLDALSPDLARGWVLSGGEDFALLGTFPTETGAELPPGFQVIGRVVAYDGAPTVTAEGGQPDCVGWDSLS